MTASSPLPSRPTTAERPAPLLRSDPARRLAPTKPKKPARHGLYAGAWALSGLLAGTYVFALVVRQDSGPLLARDGETAFFSKTQADVAQLQKTVGQLEGDVARIKIDQAQADDREKQMVQRVGTIENRVEQFAGQVVALAPAKAPKTAAAEKAAPVAPPAARIATGALPTPPPAPAPQRELAAVRQGAPGAEVAAGVVLARGPSVDALRLSWSLLNERYKGSLKALEPRVVEVEPGSFQLVAGPVANPAEAMKVCADLKARGVSCQAGDFKGSAL